MLCLLFHGVFTASPTLIDVLWAELAAKQ
jgi:hypothetical protein